MMCVYINITKKKSFKHFQYKYIGWIRLKKNGTVTEDDWYASHIVFQWIHELVDRSPGKKAGDRK